MTWLDVSEGRPANEKRDKLLADRDALQDRVLKLRESPLRNSTKSAALERAEDLIALAKKIKGIDTKLGRTQV